MSLFYQWLLFASIQAAVTIWPGPAFAMTVRSALKYDRKIGIATAFGLSLGVCVYACLVAFGLAVVMAKSIFLMNFLRYAGAAYLLYMGVKALLPGKTKAQEAEEHVTKAKKSIGVFKAINMGLLTNLLNPKAMVFFTAVYAQFIGPQTPLEIAALYAATSTVIEFVWFAIVSVILTNARVKKKFLSFAHWIERACGAALVGLGLKMVIMK